MHASDSDKLAAAAEALQAVLTALEQQARTDATLRKHLATLGETLSTIAAAATPAVPGDKDTLPVTAADTSATVEVEPEPAEHVDADNHPPSPRASRADIERLAEVLKSGGLDDETPEQRPPVEQRDDGEADHAYLERVSSCCAANAAILRADDRQADTARDYIDGCDYWVLVLIETGVITRADCELLAGNYETVAAVAETLADVLRNPTLDTFRVRGLELLAEVQSALRAAVASVRTQPDPAQESLFRWVSRRAREDSVYIKRYMRKTDVADPAAWRERLGRITTWREQIDDLVYRRRHEQKLLAKLRSQLGLVATGEPDALSHTLQIVVELVDHGLPPSNRVLRELLLPQRDALAAAAGSSRQLGLVLREIDKARRAVSTTEPADEGGTDSGETQIDDVAELLRGTAVVLVGGDERPRAAQAIEEAFDLDELIWCDTRPHTSHQPLEAAIARADVSVVLLAIRWASHGLGEIRTFCERYNKPLVRLPGGYNVAQLAYQIWMQASARLEAQRVGGAP